MAASPVASGSDAASSYPRFPVVYTTGVECVTVRKVAMACEPFHMPTVGIRDIHLAARDEIMQTAGFGLSTIGQIAQVVHDVERATAFYRDTLGMKHPVQRRVSWRSSIAGGIRLMLSKAGESWQFESSKVRALLQSGRHQGALYRAH